VASKWKQVMENNKKAHLANFDKTGQPVSNIPNMKG
jgi:hypothetical protein